MDKASAYALEMALATGRPLLIRGEPGIGKSQLARAAAVKLKRLFISHVVNINSEGQDLLWHYDPVARLNDAQALRNINTNDDAISKLLHPGNYLNPGVLWWTFNWETAQKQYKVCRHKIYQPENCHDDEPPNGMVLLLDEIDKADPALPNTLLEALGNGGFEVPLINQTVNQKTDIAPPLVIITTNEERELPPAFLRRCLVLNLSIDEEKIVPWLIERGNVHFPDQPTQAVKKRAAEYLQKDRKAANQQGTVKPGQAEYIDLLDALQELSEHEPEETKNDKQMEWLEEIKNFALCKAPQQ